MEENRRGFLKTLGKLATAVGITTAAATLPVKEEVNIGYGAALAKIDTTPKAKPPTLPDPPYEFGFTGFTHHPDDAYVPSFSDLGDPTAEGQRAIDAVHNMRLDNATTQMRPDMMVAPPAMYDWVQRQEAIRSLDPYNWGAVFDVKWHDWHSTDARFATKRAFWEAKPHSRYRDIFPDLVYRQSMELSMEYLITRVGDAEPIKQHAKRTIYERLIQELQEAIRLVIQTRDLNQDLAANITTSNRDKFFAKNPDAAARITG